MLIQESVNNEKIAVYCGTSNVYEDMLVAATSLLENSNVDKIYFLIENDEFPYKLPDKIETKNVANQEYFSKDGPNYRNTLTYMVLMRAALSKIFLEYDRILSLDIDTIVDKDISDIWDLNIDNYYFAAALEPECSKGGKWEKLNKYYNCGVVLFNLKKLRDDKVDDEIIQAINDTYFQCAEQDALNIVCQGHILEMKSEYNASDWTKATKKPKIYHYAAISAPMWREFDVVQKYRRIADDNKGTNKELIEL